MNCEDNGHIFGTGDKCVFCSEAKTVDNKQVTQDQKTAVELKPCPFCRGEAKIEDGGFNHYRVACIKCGATVGREHMHSGLSLQKIRAQWNTRSIPESAWQTIESFPHDGSCVDLLLNGNARVPDCYFDYYTKEWLMAGTDVPVMRQDDPINKITHAVKHLPLPPSDSDKGER